MPKGTTTKGGSKQPRKQPQTQIPDPVAPARTSRSTAAQVLPVPAPAPVAQIFPTQEQLQAPLNLRSQSPGELFDKISSGSDSDLDDQPTTPTWAVGHPQVPVLVSPIKAQQKRAAEQVLSFVFICKDHPELHSSGPIIRARKKGGADGTSNLQKGVDSCLRKRGIELQKNTSTDAIPYSESGHHVLIAMQCAKQSWPINSVLDEDYLQEVEMLRPGTKVPHATTVQRDLIHIYEHASTWVMNYFLVCFISYSTIKYELILHLSLGFKQCNSSSA
jgi:hypothetical protein